MEGIHDFERIEDIRLVHILFIHKKIYKEGKTYLTEETFHRS